MAEDRIESIKRSSTQRQNLWDAWQKVFDEMDADLDPGKDPFESPAAKCLMKLGGHLVAQMAREAAQDRSKLIQERGIIKLRDAHKPGIALPALYATSIASSIIGAGFGCAPHMLGVTGNAATFYQSIAGGVQGVGGQGSQSIAGLLQSTNQGEIDEIRYEVDRDKQIHGDDINEQQAQQRLYQAHAEDEKRVEQARHEATKAVTQ